MKINKSHSSSLKNNLSEYIIHEIFTGKLKTGEKIPTQRLLSNQFGISKTVVNAAINELVEDGFLRVVPRVGTFVTDFRKTAGLKAFFHYLSYAGNLIEEDRNSVTLILNSFISRLICADYDDISDETKAIFFELLEKIKTAPTPVEAAEVNMEFYHMLAVQSNDTLLPLELCAYKNLLLNYWEATCRLNGNKVLFTDSLSLWDTVNTKQAHR